MSLVLVLTEVCYLSFAPGLFFLKNKTSYKNQYSKTNERIGSFYGWRWVLGSGWWAVSSKWGSVW